MMTWDYQKHYRNRRLKAIEYLGCKCVDCGTEDTRVLIFDHAKERRLGGRTIGAMQAWGWDRLQPELDKCELVCANCHMIRTAIRKEQGNYR